MPEVTVYQCPGGCPPGECDTRGEHVSNCPLYGTGQPFDPPEETCTHGKTPNMCVECTEIAVLSDPVARKAYRENLAARVKTEEHQWGVYILTGPRAGEWCSHVKGPRIEVDKRTAKTIALLFAERFHRKFKYEARRLPE
jgi:hypothetical protein